MMNTDELLLKMKNSNLYDSLINKRSNFNSLSKELIENVLLLDKGSELKFISNFIYNKHMIINAKKLDIFKRFFICFYYEENKIVDEFYFYIYRKYNVMDYSIQRIGVRLYVEYFRNFIKNP